MTPARRVLVAPIRFYQRFVSPAVGPRCKYHPSCSEYAVGAIRSFGVLRGSVLSVWRLLRCNPWSLGGVDHPHGQTLFPSPPTPRRQP
jgi:putative membrane protein insertion efficiency factor